MTDAPAGNRKIRRAAVIGAGTAGYMAAATLTHHYPDLELFHVHDPSIPTIGVGEGTVVTFPKWVHAVTPLSEADLASRCGTTRKYGITFENWGTASRPFTHDFYPVGKAWGYHVSATEIVKVLGEHVKAALVPNTVTAVESDGRNVRIRLKDREPLDVDFAFDARGFPALDDPDVHPLAIIPTNAALIKTGPPVPNARTTRSIARPHGWVFVIPLLTRTAYGYVHNGDISSAEEVELDLDRLMADEGVVARPGMRQLRFPNFTRRTVFDGSLFSIGNRASFLEPLEATAIGVIHSQVEAARRWPLGRWRTNPPGEEERAATIDSVNRHFYRFALKVALFLGWHYSEGSAFSSPFWDFARENFRKEKEAFPDPQVVDQFNRFMWKAGTYAGLDAFAAALVDGSAAGNESIFDTVVNTFGPWPVESFIQMQRGLGLSPMR